MSEHCHGQTDGSKKTDHFAATDNTATGTIRAAETYKRPMIHCIEGVLLGTDPRLLIKSGSTTLRTLAPSLDGKIDEENLFALGDTNPVMPSVNAALTFSLSGTVTYMSLKVVSDVYTVRKPNISTGT